MPTAASLANLRPPWTPAEADAARQIGHQVHRDNRDLAASLARQKNNPVADPYLLQRVKVTRKAIKSAERRLTKQTDPKQIKAIADALYRLHEVERMLSGRPLPGTLKPTTRREQPSPTYSDPVPEPPQPVVNCGSDEPSI